MATFLKNALDIIKGLPTTSGEVSALKKKTQNVPVVNQAAKRKAALQFALENAKKSTPAPTRTQIKAPVPFDVLKKAITTPAYAQQSKELLAHKQARGMEETANLLGNILRPTGTRLAQTTPLDAAYAGGKSFVGGAASGAVNTVADVSRALAALSEADWTGTQKATEEAWKSGLIGAEDYMRYKNQAKEEGDRYRNAVKFLAGDPEKNIPGVTGNIEAAMKDKRFGGVTDALYGAGNIAGNLGTQVATSYVSKMPKLAMLLNTIGSGGRIYDEARSAGKNPKEALNAGILGGLVTHYAQKVGNIPQLDKIGGNLKRDVLGSFLREGGEEGVEQFGQNLVARGMYDENRSPWEGVLESALAGGVAGGVIGAGTSGLRKLGMNLPSSDTSSKGSYDALVKAGMPKSLATFQSGRVGTNIMEGIKNRVNDPDYVAALRGDKLTSGPDFNAIRAAEIARKNNTTPEVVQKASKYESVDEFIKAMSEPETVSVWWKSKFNKDAPGSYVDLPVVRKENNITLYQGSNPGEQRQFWTTNKSYASQFGDVKTKTGDFYKVDNGNRVIDVYVEAKPQSRSNLIDIWEKSQKNLKETGALLKEAKKYDSAEEFIKKGRSLLKVINDDYTFPDESLGSYSGQTDWITYAVGPNGNRVGRVEYSVYDGKPYVKYIEVDPSQRGKGLGRDLLVTMYKDFSPGTEFDGSGLTEDGARLHTSIDNELRAIWDQANSQSGTTFNSGFNPLNAFMAERMYRSKSEMDQGMPELDEGPIGEFDEMMQNTTETTADMPSNQGSFGDVISKGNIADSYRSNSGYDNAVMEIIAEMESSEAGRRVRTGYGPDAEVYGIKSTFPDWVPSELRDSKLFNKVLGQLDFDNPLYPKAANVREKALVDAILDRLDEKLGVDTQSDRIALEQKSEAYWADKKNEAKAAAKQKTIESKREKARAKAEEKIRSEVETEKDRIRIKEGLDERIQKFFESGTGQKLSAPEERSRLGVLETLKLPVNKLVESTWTKGIDYLEKGVQRGGEKMALSGNKYLKMASDTLGGFFRYATISPERAEASMKYQGGIANAPRLSEEFQTAMYTALNPKKDPEALKNTLSRVHDVLDPEMSKGTKMEDLNAGEKAVYKLLRNGFDLVHDMSYAEGFISKEVYEANKGKYVPRMYRVWELPQDLKSIKQSKEKLDLDPFKQRESVDDWKLENQLKDPVYSLAKRLAQLQVNKTINDYIGWLGKNGYVRATPKDGWVQMPDSKAYGKLAGGYVPQSVVEDFQGFFFMNDGLNKAYDLFKAYGNSKVMRGLKKTFTVHNPTTHLGNFTSNNVFGFIAGINPASLNKEMVRLLSTKKGKADAKQYTNWLTQNGIMGRNVTLSDLGENLKQLESVVGKVDRGVLKKMGDRAKALDEKVTAIYGGTDDYSKMAALSIFLKRGYTLKEATEKVSSAFQNYSRVGKFYDMFSKTPIVGAPFIKFQGNFLEMFKEMVKRKPLTTLAFGISLKALADGLSQISGESEEERKLREGRLGATTIPFTNISLNWKIGDSDVNIARYIVPFYTSQFENVVEGAGPATFKKFMPGGSLLDIVGKNIQGEDTSRDIAAAFQDPILGTLMQAFVLDQDFRGKSISDPTSTRYGTKDFPTDAEKLGNQLKFLQRSFTPPVINSIEDAASTMQGGKDYYGRERSPMETLMRLAGIKVEKFGPEQYTEQSIKESTYNENKQERIENDIKAIVRKEIDGEFTTEEMINKVKSYSSEYEGDALEFMREYRDEEYKDKEKQEAKVETFKTHDPQRYNEVVRNIRAARAKGYSFDDTWERIEAKDAEVYEQLKTRAKMLDQKVSTVPKLYKYTFKAIYDEVANE